MVKYYSDQYVPTPMEAMAPGTDDNRETVARWKIPSLNLALIRAQRAEDTDLKGDFSFPGEEVYDLLREDRLSDATFLNAAALPMPDSAIARVQDEIFKREAAGTLSADERSQILTQARTHLAKLVSAHPAQVGVGLCLNGSHAMNIALQCLTGLPQREVQDQPSPSLVGRAIATDLEYVGTKRELQIRREGGVARETDNLASRPTFGTKLGHTVRRFQPIENSVEISKLEAYGKGRDDMLGHLEALLQEHADSHVLILSHVDRHTGRELPVADLCRLAKRLKPDIFIIVDGAQALGNVPKVEFYDLGCDVYVGCTQKAIGAEVCGVIFYDRDNERIQSGLKSLALLPPEEQIVRRGMFEDVVANVDEDVCAADLVGVIETIQLLESRGLTENDFSAIDAKRREIRLYFLDRLKDLSKRLGVGLIVPTLDNPTNFIQSFKFFGLVFRGYGEVLNAAHDDREPHHWYRHLAGAPDESGGHLLARSLAEHGAFVAYLAPPNLLRASFQYTLTKRDVDTFMNTLEDVLKDERFHTIRLSYLRTLNRWW